jgi:transposase
VPSSPRPSLSCGKSSRPPAAVLVQIIFTEKEEMGYSESFKLQVVSEYEGGDISIGKLQAKYKIPGNSTIQKWVKKYGKTGLGSVLIKKDKNVRIDDKVENITLKNELEAARLKIAALEALVDASSKLTGIDLKKKFGGKR